ncbi:hypothetical protein AB3R30_08495 [Leptolyngbyaceae cyanobacterium UHCC 1019]
MMLKSYEAILENGQMIWVADQPNVESARVIVTILEAEAPRSQRRTAAPAIAGQGRTVGDLVSPIVDEQDWECLK